MYKHVSLCQDMRFLLDSYLSLIRFFMTTCKLGKYQSLNQFFSLIFFYIIDFFINLQMSTEWEFAIFNTAIIIFCLIYSLNISHSNQNKKPQYQSLQNWHFGDISSYCCAWWGSRMKIILISLFVWFYHETGHFYHFTGDGLVSGFDGNAKYIFCLSFPDAQPKSNE